MSSILHDCASINNGPWFEVYWPYLWPSEWMGKGTEPKQSKERRRCSIFLLISHSPEQTTIENLSIYNQWKLSPDLKMASRNPWLAWLCGSNSRSWVIHDLPSSRWQGAIPIRLPNPCLSPLSLGVRPSFGLGWLVGDWNAFFRPSRARILFASLLGLINDLKHPRPWWVWGMK